MIVTVDLSLDQAAALHRLCSKLSHQDALRFLYPHIPREIRNEQASAMCAACLALQRTIETASGAGHWPWIDTGAQQVVHDE